MTMTPLKALILDAEWDAPFFKKLARNDTGEASGHQGGPALPKMLHAYLPTLNESIISTSNPTVERYLNVTMYIGLAPVAEAPVRYQFQTWGGSRPVEARLTEGFGPLHRISVKDDILIFQRQIDSLSRFRILLIRRNSPEYLELEALIAGRRWGKLLADQEPLTQNQITQASQDLGLLSGSPFVLITNNVQRLPIQQLRIARSVVFRETVQREYDCKCAVTGVNLTTPSASFEVEAAHIVPISMGGSDDVRNGLSLSQTIHWAFDRGLFGVTPERKIYIPNRVRAMARNAYLHQFEGRLVTEAKTHGFRAHADAYAWHLEHRVRRWE
jgi:putative restriction endonuclease